MDEDGIIGIQIRRKRMALGLSLEALEDKLCRLGVYNISAYMIGTWERGERSIPAFALYHLSRALDCSIPSFYDGLFHQNDTNRHTIEYNHLQQRTKETIVYAMTEWDGNTKALGEFVRMYISVPSNERKKMSRHAIHHFERYTEQHKPVLDVNIELLKKANKKLR